MVSAAREARCIPGGIRETSRRVDRTGRALVEPAKAKIAQRTLLMLPPNPPLADFFAQLWCHCNTVQIFAQRHTAGRIAWSDNKRNPTRGGNRQDRVAI